VFRAIAALALASASAHTSSSATLSSNAPWWERVTVTVTGDGQPRSCRYETSLQPNAAQHCDVSDGQAAMVASSDKGSKDQYTRLTFERRFSPAATAAMTDVQPGETLLGGQVLALAIDAHGAVTGCKIVAASGDVRPEYGCSDAAAERFNASAGEHAPATRQGYMSVIVYGHSEHVV
jgi:hypothetical protein